MKQNADAVLVTSVGMFGQGAGWGIPISMHTLAVTGDGISQKPGLADGQIQPREYLNITASFDHDIVNRAAARFTRRLQDCGGEWLWAGGLKLGAAVTSE